MNFSYKKIALLTALFALQASPLFAEAGGTGADFADVEPEEIIVTATKTRESVATVPSTFTIIDEEEIAARGVSQFKDILKDIPGLHVVQTGSFGSPVSIFTRGTNSYHTLVLIDGVKIYDPMHPQAAYNPAYLTLDNVERIEVVRGNYSTLYGSDAIGGVINIMTKKGYGKPQMSLTNEGGSFGTYKTGLGLSGEMKGLHYTLSSSWLHTDGISKANSKLDNLENDAHEDFTFSSRLDYDISDDLSAGSVVRYTCGMTELDSAGGTLQDDTNQKERQREMVFSSYVDYFPTDWLDSKLRISWMDFYRKYKDDQDSLADFYGYTRSMFEGWDLSLDWQNTFDLMEYGNVVGGFDWHKESGYSRDLTGDSVLGFTENVSTDVSTWDAGYYLQTKLDLFDSINVVGGVRLDDHSKFGLHETYKTAARYTFEPTDTSVKGGWSTGFKAPSIYQLYDPVNGNASLKPEESNSFELGFEQRLWEKVIKAEHTFFWNELDNLIDWVANDPSMWWLGGQYRNVGKARMYGFEDIFEYRLFDKAKVAYTYTFLKTQDLDTKQSLNRRPRHKHNISLIVTPTDKLVFDISCLYVGERKDARWPGQVTLDDYMKVDISGRYKINPMFEVFGRIENAFDEDYEEVDGYGVPGIAFYSGGKITF